MVIKSHPKLGQQEAEIGRVGGSQEIPGDDGGGGI